MQKAIALPMILSLLLLTGCSVTKQSTAEEQALALRTTCLASDGIRAAATVTADYGETVYQYALRVDGSNDAGSLTVVEPEDIAGITISWENGASALQYEGISLETGVLSPDGLSPTDGFPLMLDALEHGGIVESDLEQIDDQTVLVVSIANPDPQYSEESQVTFWADPVQQTIQQASIFWEGVEVLRIQLEEFSWKTS